jgi:hypothetical protein
MGGASLKLKAYVYSPIIFYTYTWHSFLCLVHNHPLCQFTMNVSGQLNVLGHYGNMLGMNCAQVCILKHANKVSLQSLLEGKYSCALKHKWLLTS